MTDQTLSRMSDRLDDWRPDDMAFWVDGGKPIAMRNLAISAFALLLASCVWMVWSAVVVHLPIVGFSYTTTQLLWLTAAPGLSGAVLRMVYAFTVPIFGGRLWTTISTASLLIPALGIGIAVQHPETPYGVMLVLALLCGFGGGNFASSMANISFFFPKEQKGWALGVNAGMADLGVAVVQFAVPLVIGGALLGPLGGGPHAVAALGAPLETHQGVWLQNAAFIWIPFILLATAAAWFGMNDIGHSQASFAEQAVIFRRMHTWINGWLYIGSFGTFIGFAATFPMLVKAQFPGVDPLAYAFLGPLVSSAARSLSGGMADRLGGARITLWAFVILFLAVSTMTICLNSGVFWMFLLSSMLVFATAGVACASTYQMVPIVFLIDRMHAYDLQGDLGRARALKEATLEAATALGFISALAAFGAFYIPGVFGLSISLTGSPVMAIQLFLIFYLSCIVVTWMFYCRADAGLHC